MLKIHFLNIGEGELMLSLKNVLQLYKDKFYKSVFLLILLILSIVLNGIMSNSFIKYFI